MADAIEPPFLSTPGWSDDYAPQPDPATPEMWDRERRAWAAYRAQKDAPDDVRDEWREAIEAIRVIRDEHGWPNRRA